MGGTLSLQVSVLYIEILLQKNVCFTRKTHISFCFFLQ